MSGPGTRSKDKPLIQTKLSFTSTPSTSTSDILPGSSTDCGKGIKRKMEDSIETKRRLMADAADKRRKENQATSSSHENGSSEMAADEKATASTSVAVDGEGISAGGTQSYDMLAAQEDPPTDSDNMTDSQYSNNDDVNDEEDGIPNNKPSSDCQGMGKPIEELKKAPMCLPSDLKLEQTELHNVHVKLPFQYNMSVYPPPYPPKYEDKWDSAYVRMPCSTENVYPVDDGSAVTRLLINLPVIRNSSLVKLEQRWDLIKKALNDLMAPSIGPFELEEAILSYNQRYANKWKFTALHHYFLHHINQDDREQFFGAVLPEMVRLALKLPFICTKPIPLLKKGKPKKLTLSQHQIACLLANAFFCTFPRRNSRSRQAEFSSYPDINFNNLFQGHPIPRKMEKLNCIIHYFKRVINKMPTGIVTFSRQMLTKQMDWRFNQSCLTDLHVSSSGTIEDNGIGMLQVDFANKYIGGGVLGHGCVQEEIRFMICPEMIVTRLFTEVLMDMESLVMTGCEQFSKYSGYADSFTWTGDCADATERDSVGRLCCEVVAIDALVFRSDYGKQFKTSCVLRELNKAYCGFMSTLKEVNKAAVCTGNWGCGAFGGDKQLKSLIQLMAAAVAKRDVCYFTFGDEKLTNDLHVIHGMLKDEEKTIGEILHFIECYNREVINIGYYRKPGISLFDFISRKLGIADSQNSSASNPNFPDFEEDSNEALELHRMDSETKKGSPDYRASTP